MAGVRTGPRFDRSLLLVRWLAEQLGGPFSELLARVKDAPAEGSPGASLRLAALCSRGVRLAPERLAAAERAFMADWQAIAAAREAAMGQRFELTHFQWLAALFVELYLSRLACDGRAAVADSLNALRQERFDWLPPVQGSDLNHVALWMATGSGKTLMLHLNALQFLRYERAILGRPLQRVLVLTPNETLSAQHRTELALSGLDEISLGHTLEVTELTKLYLPENAAGRVSIKDGVSVCTDQYPGPNLVLVDEGHKGGKSSSGEETAFRARRDAVTGVHERFPVEGPPGFEFEYSATFAQIADGDPGFFNDYARRTVFDYGYRRFHDDGFGKSPRSLVASDATSQDLVLTAALVAFWRQVRFHGEDAVRARRYRLAEPLAVFVGQSVTGKSQDVVQVVQFLARFAADARWARTQLARVLDASQAIQQALFAAQLDFEVERRQGPVALHAAMCGDLFGGSGRVAVRVLSGDELGIRLPGAAEDRWFGTAYVGDAAKLAGVLQAAGVAVEEADVVTGSLFKRLDDLPQVRFLIGSRKFIEGWSSYRVSTLGLLKIGRNAGTQVIQLFGRGVRLQGVAGRLKRSSHVPELGPHPAGIECGETLYVFGVQAEYVQTWLEALGREGLPAQASVVPVTLDARLASLGLQAPADDPARAAAFGAQIVAFVAAEHPAPVVDLSARLSLQDGVGHVQALQGGVQLQPASDLLAKVLDAEALFQRAQRVIHQQAFSQLWVTTEEARRWLHAARVRVPSALLPLARDDQQRLAGEMLTWWEAALARAMRRARLRFLTEQPLLDAVDDKHANFPKQTLPDGTTRPGYRVEALLAHDMVKTAVETLRRSLAGLRLSSDGWGRIVATLRDEAGEIDLSTTLQHVLAALEAGAQGDDLGLPLPRLHIPQHLYSPLLLAAPAQPTGPDGQLSLLVEEPVTLRISPPPLQDSEARLVWDLRRVWGKLSGQPQWQGIDVVLLRNLSGVGVGLFAADGFYPDFLLWLKQGERQVLAFVEPKGLRLQWPAEKFELLERRVPSWKFTVPIRGFVVSANTEPELRAIQPGFTWASAPAVLLYQDPQALYVETILQRLKPLLGATN